MESDGHGHQSTQKTPPGRELLPGVLIAQVRTSRRAKKSAMNSPVNSNPYAIFRCGLLRVGQRNKGAFVKGLAIQRQAAFESQKRKHSPNFSKPGGVDG